MSFAHGFNRRESRSRPRFPRQASSAESGLTHIAGVSPGVSVRNDKRMSPSSQMD